MILPFKFEAGTINYIGAIGLAEAIKYVNNLGIENIAACEHELLNYATEKLNSIEGLKNLWNMLKKKDRLFRFF